MSSLKGKKSHAPAEGLLWGTANFAYSYCAYYSVLNCVYRKKEIVSNVLNTKDLTFTPLLNILSITWPTFDPKSNSRSAGYLRFF